MMENGVLKMIIGVVLQINSSIKRKIILYFKFDILYDKLNKY